MLRKVFRVLLLLIIFLTSIPAYAQGSPFAEIFDPSHNKVIKSVRVDSEIYDLASGWVKSIDNLYGKINPSSIKGYKVRIPLDPPIKVNKKSLNSNINEVYIIVPEKESPFLMIFEDKNKPSCFKFHGNIDDLWKAMDFKLEN